MRRHLLCPVPWQAGKAARRQEIGQVIAVKRLTAWRIREGMPLINGAAVKYRKPAEWLMLPGGKAAVR